MEEKEIINKQIDITKSLVENCPRWNSCNVNRCPLEEHNFKSDSSDPETKCLLGKTRRKRLLREYPKKVKEAERQREKI